MILFQPMERCTNCVRPAIEAKRRPENPPLDGAISAALLVAGVYTGRPEVVVLGVIGLTGGALIRKLRALV